MYPSTRVGQYTPSKQLVSGADINSINNQISGAVDGLVAKAGGGKAGATPLTAHVNTIATAATAADSVILPKGFAGAEVWVINDGAEAVQVFGLDNDTINGVATGTGVSVAAASKTIFKCNKASPPVSSGGTGVSNWVTK